MGKRAIAHNKSPHGFASPELHRFDPACSLGKPVSSIRLATLPSTSVSKFGSCPSRFCNQKMTDAGGAPERGGGESHPIFCNLKGDQSYSNIRRTAQDRRGRRRG